MKADLILAGGRIRTLGRRGLQPSSHLAVAGGLVVAVGGREVLELKGGSTRVVELAGGAVLPGFNDPHAHVVYHALSSYGADLTGSRSIVELQGRLRRVGARLPAGAWLQQLPDPDRRVLPVRLGNAPRRLRDRLARKGLRGHVLGAQRSQGRLLLPVRRRVDARVRRVAVLGDERGVVLTGRLSGRGEDLRGQ